MIYLDLTGKRVSRDHAMIGSRLRDNFNAILEDGEAASFAITLRDSASSADAISLTDAERGELNCFIALERSKHDMAQAHRGADARPWTDAMTLTAEQRFMDKRSRGIDIVGDRSAFDVSDAQAAPRRSLADRAYVKSVAYLNGWRKGA